MGQIKKSIAVACASFAITNIDDAFVLVTFFSEASTSRTLTTRTVILGQYLGFTFIIAVSLIGFGASYLIPTEPMGFMGMLPLLLGIWKFFHIFFPKKEEESELTKIASVRSILKVATVTLMNGADNIGTYVPLFSQARDANIAVYIVVYYIMLGVWCLAAWLVMRQKVFIRLAQKYIAYVIPFLYIGLGLYILIKSEAYPWSIRQINKKVSTHAGRAIMATMTVFVILTAATIMLWIKLKRRKAASDSQLEESELQDVDSPPLQEVEASAPPVEPILDQAPEYTGFQPLLPEAGEQIDKDEHAAEQPQESLDSPPSTPAAEVPRSLAS